MAVDSTEIDKPSGNEYPYFLIPRTEEERRYLEEHFGEMEDAVFETFDKLIESKDVGDRTGDHGRELTVTVDGKKGRLYIGDGDADFPYISLSWEDDGSKYNEPPGSRNLNYSRWKDDRLNFDNIIMKGSRDASPEENKAYSRFKWSWRQFKRVKKVDVKEINYGRIDRIILWNDWLPVINQALQKS